MKRAPSDSPAAAPRVDARPSRRFLLVVLKIVSLVLLVCFSCVAANAIAREVAVSTDLKARVRGERVVVTERGRARTLGLAGKLSAARLEGAFVHFKSTADDGAVYLVMSVCGWSKRRQDARHCGLGTECDLVWLKLDARWRVRDSKVVRYESCWSPTTSEDDVQTSGHALSLTFDNFSEEARFRVTYDAARPERGLLVERSPLPESR